MQRGRQGKTTHSEVAAIPIISPEEITSPNSEPGSEHDFSSSTLNPLIQALDRGRPGSSHRSRTRAHAAVTHLLRSEPQATSEYRKVHFSPLAPDPYNDEPDGHPIVLVPNSSDPDLAGRVNPDPSNHASPPPPPRLLFSQSPPHSLERTQGYRTSAVDSDVERDPGGTDAFGPPITVSTQSKPSNDNEDVVSGGLKLSDVNNLEGREEAENVHQNRSGAGSRIGSQDPAEAPPGNVQDCISPRGVNPHSDTNARVPDMQHGDGVQQPPTENQPAGLPDRVEHTKPLISSFDRLSANTHRVESEARSTLQAEAEEGEKDTEVIGTSKEVTNSSGPLHSTSSLPLGRMLSLLDEAGPSRSLGGIGRTITRRPRRPITGRRLGKSFQPPAEAESGWQSEGTFNVSARSEAGVSKSDDLGYFAGL